MKTHLCGAEYSAFLTDPIWPEGAWMDDASITIDGVEESAWTEAHGDGAEIPADAKVVVQGGTVFNASGDILYSLAHLLKLWKRQQTSITRVVIVPKDKESAFKDALTALGGSFLK